MSITPLLLPAGIVLIVYLLAPFMKIRWNYPERGSLAELISAAASTATACFAFYAFFLSPVSEYVVDGMRNDLLFETKKIQISKDLVFQLVEVWPRSWNAEDKQIELFPIFQSRLEALVHKDKEHPDTLAIEVYGRFEPACRHLKERSVVIITKPSETDTVPKSALDTPTGPSAEAVWLSGSFRDPMTQMDKVRAELFRCLLDLKRG